MKWVCFQKFYSPLANWLWLRISPHRSLCYLLFILTAWQWLMSFTCIPFIEPNKSPLRKRLLALLLWEIGHLSSPSRSGLGRLIFIHDGQAELPPAPHSGIFLKAFWLYFTLHSLLAISFFFLFSRHCGRSRYPTYKIGEIVLGLSHRFVVKIK